MSSSRCSAKTASTNAARVAAALRSTTPALLFGLRLWIAVCLALYITFRRELDSPSWLVPRRQSCVSRVLAPRLASGGHDSGVMDSRAFRGGKLQVRPPLSAPLPYFAAWFAGILRTREDAAICLSGRLRAKPQFPPKQITNDKDHGGCARYPAITIGDDRLHDRGNRSLASGSGRLRAL